MQRVLHRHVNTDEYAAILILGLPGVSWHPEFALANEARLVPTPSAGRLSHLEPHGGRRAGSLDPHWDTWGVTLPDPDGDRVVPCAREWSA